MMDIRIFTSEIQPDIICNLQVYDRDYNYNPTN